MDIESSKLINCNDIRPVLHKPKERVRRQEEGRGGDGLAACIPDITQSIQPRTQIKRVLPVSSASGVFVLKTRYTSAILCKER